MKRALVYSVRAETRRQILAPFSLSWECVWVTRIVFSTLSVSVNDHESAVSIDF